jgi:hypothetical protein
MRWRRACMAGSSKIVWQSSRVFRVIVVSSIVAAIFSLCCFSRTRALGHWARQPHNTSHPRCKSKRLCARARLEGASRRHHRNAGPLPLPARDERGEGWGEGFVQQRRGWTPLSLTLSPLLRRGARGHPSAPTVVCTRCVGGAPQRGRRGERSAPPRGIFVTSATVLDSIQEAGALRGTPLGRSGKERFAGVEPGMGAGGRTKEEA